MSILDKKYVLKVDTKSTFFNPTPQFSISDNETSDFNIRVTNANKIINLSDVIAVMVVINPNNEMYSDFVEVEKAEEGLLYCNLSQSLKNIDGTWKARLMCIYGEERIVTSTFSYKVNTDEFVQLNQEVVTDDRFGTLTQMLSRLSSIELQETSRKLAELSREEAERQRELVKEKLISDIEKLIQDTNSKVDTNLKENTAKIDTLVTDTNEKIDAYKTEKDEAIQQDLQLYKQETTENINTYKNDKNIEIDNYKNAKDAEINKNLSDYKNSTTTDIETYKNSKDEELDNYKIEKDKSIDSYVTAKNKELDNYKLAKNTEINEFKDLKDTEINNKLREVDVEEQKRAAAEQQRVTDHADREIFLNSFESQLGQIVSKNGEQDNRLNSIEYVNKRQDVVMSGLLNEGKDNRLSIEGEGNSVKLEGSKTGLVTINEVVGNTLVNLWDKNKLTLSNQATLIDNKIKITTTDNIYSNFFNSNKSLFKPSTEYTFIVNVIKNTLDVADTIFITSYSSINSIGRDIFAKSSSDTFHLKGQQTGLFVQKMTSIEDLSLADYSVRSFVSNGTKSANCEIEMSIIILEGDYTNKPIPNEYFEGMQSTFEDKLVTQKMVDSGEELAENLGKCKCLTKVIGKNLFDGELEIGTISNTDGTNKISNESRSKNYTRVKSTSITITRDKGSETLALRFYDKNYNFITMNYNQYTMITLSKTFTLPSNVCYIRFKSMSTDLTIRYQIEEGTVATPYEPYKEYKTSILLPEPLYRGNELCVHDGQLGVLHKVDKETLDGSDDENWKLETTNIMTSRFFKELKKAPAFSGSVIIACDKYSETNIYEVDAEGFMSSWGGVYIRSFNKDLNTFKQELQANPVTVIYELAEPIFVPVLEDTPQWILDCFNSCTVHFETNVPILSSSFSYTGNVPSVIAMNNNLKNVNNEQLMQNEIDNTTMLAVADVYEMLMPVATMSLTKEGGNKMVELYVVLIMRGLKTIEQVPVAIRSQVEEMLKQVQ